MDELYVKIYSQPEKDVACVPLETLLTLFTLNYCDGADVQLILVKVPSDTSACSSTPTFISGKDDFTESIETKNPAFSISLSGLRYEVQEEEHLLSMAQLCHLPIILLADNATCVAGLCSVLRQVVKTAPAQYHHLLGFRSGCLMACAEVSLWTRFCEIDMAQSIKNLYAKNFQHGQAIIPEDVMRFEAHLGQPLRTHNIMKKRQELEKARINNEEIIEHAFAEGPVISLSDIILFPCFYIIFKVINASYLKDSIPLTINWFERVKNQERIRELLEFIVGVEKTGMTTHTYEVPKVPMQSLYKSDPKRYKPKNRIYTRQEDIDTSLKILFDVGLSAPWMDRPFGWDVPLNWADIPRDSHPENGNLPASRLARKCQQLENLARAVMKIAKSGDVIVDFCSGSGHLGLLLAVLLPKCHVLLLENKFESLDRARKRGFKLGLQNVLYVQSNLDYFKGKFDVGVALHACGVATDLVLENCIRHNASFVCCPCCYGGVQETHAIEYPRSSLLRRSALSLRDYLVLGHAADQTHGEDHEKSVQGNTCMAFIDADRCEAARERGYQVSMAKLDPPSCTPKNNLLVGVPSS